MNHIAQKKSISLNLNNKFFIIIVDVFLTSETYVAVNDCCILSYYLTKVREDRNFFSHFDCNFMLNLLDKWLFECTRTDVMGSVYRHMVLGTDSSNPWGRLKTEKAKTRSLWRF